MGMILFLPTEVMFLRVHIKRMRSDIMTEGSIWKKILIFSIPLILGNLLQQMYNTVDSMIVGNFVGSNALAAVGSGTAIINLLISFSQGAAVGAGIVVANYYGAKNEKQVQNAVHTSLGISLVLGLILSVLGVCFTKQLLIWMNTPAEVMADSISYMRLYSAGLIFNIFYNMAAGILNAVGNSRRSLIYLGAASITNIVLDLVLIAGFHMGVEGAAIATDISQAVSGILALGFLMKVSDSYRVNIRKIGLQKKMASSIIRIGLPAGIQNMVISLSNVLVQASVNGFGAAVMAGFGVYMKIDGFNILPVMSFSMAVTTFTGQNLGAGKIDRIKEGMWVTILMGIIYTIATGMLLLIFARPIVGMFTKDEEVIANGVAAMCYFCPFYSILATMHALAGTIRGTGKTIPPMMILLISMCAFRVLWVNTVVPAFHVIQTVYVLYPISWALSLTLMILYAWKGRWLPENRTMKRKGGAE